MTVVLALLALLAGLVAPETASAAPPTWGKVLGTLKGMPLTDITAGTGRLLPSAACPAGTRFYAAYWWFDANQDGDYQDVADIGDDITNNVVISTNNVGLSAIAVDGVPLDNNYLGLAAQATRTLVNGRYEVSLVCYSNSTALPDAATGQFNGFFTASGGVGSGAASSITWDDGSSAKATTTKVTTSPASPVAAGVEVTLTADVSPVAAGTVQFTDTQNGTVANLGDPQPLSGGRAAVALRGLASGAHAFGATFTPADAGAFRSSSATPVPYRVLGLNQTATTTTLTTSPAGGGVRGTPVSLIAQVAPAGVAGRVTFSAGGTPLGEVPVNTGGVATLAHTFTDEGDVSLSADFVPTDDAAVAGSASAPITFSVSEPLAQGPLLDQLVIVNGDVGTKNDRGTTAQALGLTSATACPAATTLVSVRMSGPGAFARGIGVGTNGSSFLEPDDTVKTETLGAAAARAGLSFVPGKYTVYTTCRSASDDSIGGFMVGNIWFYDADNWLNADPAVVGIPTTVTLEVAPAGRADLGTVSTITARLTPALVDGTVTFDALGSDGSTTVIGTARVVDATATVDSKALPFGLYYLTGTLTPGTAGAKYNASTSPEVVQAITRITPPIPTRAASITGTAVVGKSVTCASGFKNATSTRVAWLRDGVTIAGTKGTAYGVVAADKGHVLVCQAFGVNAGGEIRRDSPGVKVTK